MMDERKLKENYKKLGLVIQLKQNKSLKMVDNKDFGNFGVTAKLFKLNDQNIKYVDKTY
jgi:hypothetical protein